MPVTDPGPWQVGAPEPVEETASQRLPCEFGPPVKKSLRYASDARALNWLSS